MLRLQRKKLELAKQSLDAGMSRTMRSNKELLGVSCLCTETSSPLLSARLRLRISICVAVKSELTDMSIITRFYLVGWYSNVRNSLYLRPIDNDLSSNNSSKVNVRDRN